jgi:cbb3-type cytochrome oxidase subunit 3
MSEGTVHPAPTPDGHPEHPDVRHERTDASFGGIFSVIVIAALIGVVIHVVVWLYLARIREHEALAKKSPFPLNPGPSTALPREPRLEQVDRLANEEQRTEQYLRERNQLRVLDSYGPTDDEGYLHVPIEQAMRYLATEKKLPSRPEPSAGQRRRAGGLVDAGESNSGRLFREGAK